MSAVATVKFCICPVEGEPNASASCDTQAVQMFTKLCPGLKNPQTLVPRSSVVIGYTVISIAFNDEEERNRMRVKDETMAP